jgi:hypothetical protein
MDVAKVVTVRRGHGSGGHHSGNEGVDENHCEKGLMESRVNLKKL